MKYFLSFCSLLLALQPAALMAQARPLSVRGLHLSAPSPDGIPLLVRFVEEELPKLHVNTLVVEVNYRFQFESFPKLAQEPALSKEAIQQLVAACRKSGVRLIPGFNCLGHQSWAERTFPLLTVYPEFDETPGRYPENKGIYCRSWCPRHPDVHTVVFALLAELADAFEASAFHVGMDEVFLLGEDDCPRCRGRNKARLFADEVNLLHEFLSKRGIEMWMWGDRFIDGSTSGIGEWEASLNGTQPAIELVPKDIVINDWHYEAAVPTPAYFALAGFGVVAAPWRKLDVALGQLDQMRLLRATANPEVSERMLGVLQTTWTSPENFIHAFHGEGESSVSAREAADCFRKLFTAMQP